MSVVLFSLAAFLAVLAILITQLHAVKPVQPPKIIVVRRIYQTTLVETVIRQRPNAVSKSPAGVSGSAAVSSSTPPASASAATANAPAAAPAPAPAATPAPAPSPAPAAAPAPAPAPAPAAPTTRTSGAI